MATVITKESDSIITTVDGVITNIQSIRREDNVISVTPSSSYGEVFNIVREIATGNIIVYYDSSSVTIDPTNLTGAEIKALYEAEANAFTDTKNTKLSGIDTGAKDDQTGAEIKSAYEGEANTNAYTDAEKTKLSGVATGADVTDSNPPQAHTHLTVSETEVFNGTSPTSWTDLDLSGTIGSQVTLVLLKINSSGTLYVAVRKNSDTDDFYTQTSARVSGAAGSIVSPEHDALLVATDASGKIEWKASNATAGTTVDIIAYIK